MDIEIRRNRDLTFTLGPENEKALKELRGLIPPLTEEQRRMLDNGARIRHELEEKIWAHFNKNEVYDLLGDLIMRETHEIGFDVETEEHGGMNWAVAKNIYVRPKKSEYEKC